jgi:Putative Flp pilus-assembly TadE/G-like
MKLFRDERGQTTIIMALSILCLCGMAGFAVDVGMLFRAKRVIQTAADAAALAGAAELKWEDGVAAAKAAAASNGVTDGVGGATVVVNNPPQSGYHTGGTFVEVIVTQSQPTYFMKLFHLSSMPVSARAVAGIGPSTGCIYTLDPSGVDIGLTGSGTLSMPDCGIIVNSASNNAVNLTGVSDLTALSIGIVGGYSKGSNTTINPTPVTGIPPVGDPLSFVDPPTFTPSSCLADPHPTANATLGPSIAGGTICYNGLSISGSGTVTLNPGVYVINGALSSSGSATISGTGITFYLAPPNGSVSLTGSGALDISAPTDPSNPYNGILFYEDPSDTNAMKVAGNSNSQIQGIFYAPNASLTLTGTSGSNFYADLVVHSLSISGNGTLQNYSGINKNEPITSARLVE